MPADSLVPRNERLLDHYLPTYQAEQAQGLN